MGDGTILDVGDTIMHVQFEGQKAPVPLRKAKASKSLIITGKTVLSPPQGNAMQGTQARPAKKTASPEAVRAERKKLESLLIGCYVRDSHYAYGLVRAISNGTITVLYPEEDKLQRYPFPQAFDRGTLTIPKQPSLDALKCYQQSVNRQKDRFLKAFRNS